MDSEDLNPNINYFWNRDWGIFDSYFFVDAVFF
jgi:hypothetical protein